MQEISSQTIKEASEGSMSAFRQIYDKTSGFVYNVALRILNNKEDAQEVTQDVFVNIFKSLNKYQFESSLKTWIYRITVNTSLNCVRKRKKEVNKHISYDVTLEKNPGLSISAPGAKRLENEELVTRLLDMLNPDQRACVVLRNIEGLSYEEIALALATNINTVRSRLKRAREILLNRKNEVN